MVKNTCMHPTADRMVYTIIRSFSLNIVSSSVEMHVCISHALSSNT